MPDRSLAPGQGGIGDEHAPIIGCDPAAMVDALTSLYLGLLATVVGPNGRRIDACHDYLREHMPDALGGQRMKPRLR